MSLTDILANARPAKGRFDAHIPDSWLQGRTAATGETAISSQTTSTGAMLLRGLTRLRPM